MIGAERLFKDRQRPLEERCGLCIAFVCLIEQSQILSVCAGLRIVRPESSLVVRDELEEQWFGSGQIPLTPVGLRQVAHTLEGLLVSGPKIQFVNRDRSLGKRLGCREIPLGFV